MISYFINRNDEASLCNGKVICLLWNVFGESLQKHHSVLIVTTDHATMIER